MYRRPLLRTSYAQDTSILPTYFQKAAMGVFLLGLILTALGAPVLSGIPKFFLGSTWINPVTNMLPLAIAALGFTILVGVTGHVD